MLPEELTSGSFVGAGRILGSGVSAKVALLPFHLDARPPWPGSLAPQILFKRTPVHTLELRG